METELKVDGMHCQHCAARVKKASESIPNVTNSDVNLDTGIVVISHDGADMNSVIDAINALGFSASMK